mmetsp:Transcript_13613/g.34689  ORF Transcript_13613/g.34689 Transcript_13613/m.34689 type:complete len:302 (+) Transcript_13613:324-1229(+)
MPPIVAQNARVTHPPFAQTPAPPSQPVDDVRGMHRASQHSESAAEQSAPTSNMQVDWSQQRVASSHSSPFSRTPLPHVLPDVTHTPAEHCPAVPLKVHEIPSSGSQRYALAPVHGTDTHAPSDRLQDTLHGSVADGEQPEPAVVLKNNVLPGLLESPNRPHIQATSAMQLPCRPQNPESRERPPVEQTVEESSTWQVAEQQAVAPPSPGEHCALAASLQPTQHAEESSHSSRKCASTTPFPQCSAQLDIPLADSTQAQPHSSAQAVEHPSMPATLPSSQPSPVSRMLFPHTGAAVVKQSDA